MKKWFGKFLPAILLGIVGLSTIFIGLAYFNFTEQRIYEDSTDHLGEIYGQVNRSFGAFVERNWGLLENWGDYFTLAEDENTVAAFIEDERKYWGFSEFYLLSGDENCVTLSGASREMDLGEEWYRLTEQDQPIMAGEELPNGVEVTVFAVPVAHNTYKGFAFDAVAVSYTNADLARSLNVNAFSGQAKCFVIHDDGSVLLSTQTGGNVFSNYLVYLRAASDLTAAQLAQLQRDWQTGTSGLLRCQIGDVSHCILYQPVGYQDYQLLSVVPQTAISAGFLEVQTITIYVLALIFLLVGATVVVILLWRNRKQSRQSRLELQYRERMFDVLSNSVDDIFLMLNAEDLNVDYISPNIERLVGIPLAEARENVRVLEKCAVNGDILIPRDDLEAIPLHGNDSWECEYMHQTTGERRWYRMTVYHMSLEDVKKYIIVLSDRTMEQQMNQRMREALTAAQSANEAKSNFLSNMSHDIRTPMNAIVGLSLLLEKNADDPEKVREYTRKITVSSHHLLSLINDVLDMSKIESGKTSLNVDRFSLPELLEELDIILAPQVKAKGQSFEMRVQGAPPEQLTGDKLRLNQILINTLSNAIKYTPEGGKIEFTVCELPQVTPQYVKLRFIVRDNGIGMSEDFQKRVFDPFTREINSVTNKVQGTGLGLAITKNLVDLMGGVIQVESKLGEGSTFTIDLSFALPEQDELAAWLRERVRRILVADDEEDVCREIEELMREAAIDVSWVTSGAAAVEAAAQAQQAGEPFDVILLDWRMPDLDGVETARVLRTQLGTEVPVVALTSYDWSDIEAEAREAGINAFMPKPFFASTFWQTVEPLFAGQAGQAQRDNHAAEGVMEGRLFLVAEDNELNAEILTELLEMEGARCEVAVNGKEAVEMFERAEPGYYDMVLMDVQMPVMNGYEATRAIRASKHPAAKTIPIVSMTANTFAEDVRNAMDSGMDGHLAKPVDMTAVREVVGKLLRRNAES